MDVNEFIKAQLTEAVEEKCGKRFAWGEVEHSLQQVASRWLYVLDYHEKKAVARHLGGNKYAKTTHALLDALFESILDERQSE